MNKIGWQAAVSAVVLFAAVWAIKCYGGSNYDRGRREAETAHSDSSRIWMARGADSVSRLTDVTVTKLVRTMDSLASENTRIKQRALEALARERQARETVNHIPKEILDRADPAIRSVLDSVLFVNDDLKAAVVSLSAQNNVLLNQLAADTVAMRRLQNSRDRWKGAYDTASTEIRQLKNLKTPRKPRFGFKAGFVTGIVATVGAVIAALTLSH